MQKILRRIREKIEELTGYTIIKLPSGISYDINFITFRNFFKSIRDVEGNIVECGVGYGENFLILTRLVRLERKGRNIWGFDSFEGFPEPTIHDKSPRNPKKGDWGNTSKERILNYLTQYGIEPSFIKNI